ncbi:hypothetical protein HYPGJ_31000 [Hyphomicrobium sp. GJ21]|nr:hypothetical protein HYPGJ_31000 [Hyphomicrobium sp. GJ21]
MRFDLRDARKSRTIAHPPSILIKKSINGSFDANAGLVVGTADCWGSAFRVRDMGRVWR